jgi:hypothetical protein
LRFFHHRFANNTATSCKRPAKAGLKRLMDEQRYSPLPDAFMTYGPPG